MIAAVQCLNRAHPLKTLSGGECATNSVSMASRVPALGASSGPRGLKVGGFSLTPGCCSRQLALSGVCSLTQQSEDSVTLLQDLFAACAALSLNILPPCLENVFNRSLKTSAALTCRAEAVQSV